GGSSRGGSGTVRGGSLAGGSSGRVGSRIGLSEEGIMPRSVQESWQGGQRVDAVPDVRVSALAVEQDGREARGAGAAVVLDERISDMEDLGRGQVEALAGAQE